MAKKKTVKKKETKSKESKVSKSKTESTQPEVNIGLIGHVDHGKTTLVKSLTGRWTDTHSEELKRGITIRLGYADASFYKCTKCNEHGLSAKCRCGGEAALLRHVSFVDAPGHESLMATMLCGANIMDGAILLISANERCPQPQTKEHLMALEIVGIKNLVVVQNKIDLVTEEEALKNYNQIKKFLENTVYKDVPVIPMSAQHGINIDALIETLEEFVKTPERDPDKDPMMFIARSFDINKPGTEISKMVGGILGGVLKEGKLENGQEIEILPGYPSVEKNQAVWKPLRSKITGLMTGGKKVDTVYPGGSIAVLTLLDPSIVKSDQLVGAVVGLSGKLPPVWSKLSLDINLLERVVGAKDDLVVEAVKPGEPLMLNVNSAATVGVVTSMKKGVIECTLKRPVCAENGARITVSRRMGNRWRLIGFALIKE